MMTTRQAAEKRGITSSYQLQKRLEEAGFKTYPTMASKLWNNKMVTLPTLDMVAEALNCELQELYSWKPNKKSAKNGRNR